MDRSNVFYLIKETYTADSIGQQVPLEERRMVYCNIDTIGQNEFFSAGEHGIRAELKLTMFAPDYHGEELAEVTAFGITKKYFIYRTYRRTNEDLELYLGIRTGVE